MKADQKLCWGRVGGTTREVFMFSVHLLHQRVWICMWTSALSTFQAVFLPKACWYRVWCFSLRWSSRTVSRNVQLIHTVTCQLWCNIELLVSDLCSFKKPQCIWQGRKVDCDSPNTFSCLCKGFFLVLSGMNYLPEALAFESQKGHLYSTQELFNRITLLLLNKI